MAFEDFVKGTVDFLQEQDTGGYATQPPLTRTVSAHSITIRTDSGIKIGRIQSWGPSLARTIDTLYEVQANNTGEPLERVPQIQTGNKISVERFELYTAHIGEAFGTPTLRIGSESPAESGSSNPRDLVNLTRQIKPFNVREVWRDPYGDIRAYMYVGIYFSDLGITIAATDDRIVKSSATLEFTRRIRLN